MMTFRPTVARWFECLVARDDVTLALETLARSAHIELEQTTPATEAEPVPDLRQQLDTFDALAERYQEYWPDERIPPSEISGRPARTMEQALHQLHAWESVARSLIDDIERLKSETTDLERIEDFLQHVPARTLDFNMISQAGPQIAPALYLLQPLETGLALPETLIPTRVDTPTHRFLFVLTDTGTIERLTQDMVSLQARRIPLPDWLKGDAGQALAQIRKRLDELEESQSRLGEELVRCHREHGIAEALGDIHRLRWFVGEVRYMPVTHNLVWLRGWTDDMTGQRMQRALAERGLRGLVQLAPAPGNVEPPTVLRNPVWAKPFELFPGLLGIPATHEADPSQLLALVVPLMFGYMFGDVGHGLVLVIAGFALRTRVPVTRLLIPAGASAMLFGLFYGGVFASENIIPALWLRPLESPLLILALPVGAGILLLLFGLLLNAFEEHWRGQAPIWWWTQAPVAVIYIALIAALFMHSAWYVVLGAIIWYLIGLTATGHAAPITRIAGGIGKLLENIFQLAVNTVSFIRVGAFALAHAGLSQAVLGLATVTENRIASTLIVVVGNLIVIALEGLIVSIQITRLVLFEFFIRFLRGEGRRLRPLEAPDYLPSESRRQP